MSKVILFVFAGRRANLELQRPFLERILQENPDVTVHLWNLTRNAEDDAYVRTMGKRRILVRNEFADRQGDGFNLVWQHYADPKYRNIIFVKADDDVVFIETGQFKAFIEAVQCNRHAVVSADVINNGACTPLNPPINDLFRRMRMPLLDVHLHPRYAEACHRWFLDHWKQMVPGMLHYAPTKDWLSINFIGYDHDMAKKIAGHIGQRPPHVIAQRRFRPSNRIGDEGAVNMLPRIIVKGFTVAHLTFGPQEKKAPDMWTDLRKRYADIGREYLGAV